MLVPAQAGIAVGEYAPNQVKKTVVGVGHADKRQIDHMVRLQLPGVEIAGRGRGRRARHRAVPCPFRPHRRPARGGAEEGLGMIGRIAGRLDYKAADHVLIDVRGVGYVVFVTDRTLAALPGPGEAVALYTDLLVREDLLQLFGFRRLAEKEWHRLLMSVQGVGAKASLAILGALGADGVSRAIALGDWNAVKAASGIGPEDRATGGERAQGQGAGGDGDVGGAGGGARTRARRCWWRPTRRGAGAAPAARGQCRGPVRGAVGAAEPRLRPGRRGLGGGDGAGRRPGRRHARADPRRLAAAGAERVGRMRAHPAFGRLRRVAATSL